MKKNQSKSVSFILSVSILSVFFSCSEDSKIGTINSDVKSDKSSTILSSQVHPIGFSVEDLRDLSLINTMAESGKYSSIEIQEMVNVITSKLPYESFETSFNVIDELDLNENDIIEIFGKQKKLVEIDQTEVLYVAFFVTSMNSMLDNLKSDNSSARDCFLEATGIAAGAAIIGSLTGKTVGKAAVKAAIKAAAKIGGRALGGIGLALVVAEFSYCMLTSNEIDQEEDLDWEEEDKTHSWEDDFYTIIDPLD